VQQQLQCIEAHTTSTISANNTTYTTQPILQGGESSAVKMMMGEDEEWVVSDEDRD